MTLSIDPSLWTELPRDLVGVGSIGLILALSAKYGRTGRGSRGYLAQAQTRAKKRDGSWHAISALFGVIAATGFGFLYTSGIDRLHWLVYHRGPHLADSRGIQTPLSVLGAVLFAIPPGFIVGNFLVWLIPPARRDQERRAEGVPGNSFRDAQRGLYRNGRWVVAVAVLIGIFCALIRWHWPPIGQG